MPPGLLRSLSYQVAKPNLEPSRGIHPAITVSSEKRRKPIFLVFHLILTRQPMMFECH